jgi:hypothetical protein
MKTYLKLAICCIAIGMVTTSFKTNNSLYQNGTYRIFENKTYQVLDSMGFYIYSRYAPEEINKGKGLVMQSSYFFSKKYDTNIKPLTIQNIENVFYENSRFRYLLEEQFHRDSELSEFDRYLHVYKIKYIYWESLRQP